MAMTGSIPRPPRGLLRLLARLPIWLYRARLGWLLGGRFLMLTHTGRKSGLQRHSVVEVVRYDQAMDAYYIVSGFGEKADWFRNICKNPERDRSHRPAVFGERRRACIAGRSRGRVPRLCPAPSHSLRALARVFGYPWDGTQASYEALARLLPIVRLRTRATSE